MPFETLHTKICKLIHTDDFEEKLNLLSPASDVNDKLLLANALVKKLNKFGSLHNVQISTIHISFHVHFPTFVELHIIIKFNALLLIRHHCKEEVVQQKQKGALLGLQQRHCG